MARAKPYRRERLGGGSEEDGRERRARASVPGALVGRGGTEASNRFVNRTRSASPTEWPGETLAEGPHCPEPCALPLWSLPPLRFPPPAPFHTAPGTAPGSGGARRAEGPSGPRGFARSHGDSQGHSIPAATHGAQLQGLSAPGAEGLPCRGLPFLPERRLGRAGPRPSHRRGPSLGLRSPRPGGAMAGLS